MDQRNRAADRAATSTSVVEQVRARAATLAPGARRIARFIAENPALVVASSAAQLAARLSTSDASVVRTVQALGHAGLPALRQALAASLDAGRAPSDAMRRTLAEAGSEAGDAVDLVIATHRAAVENLAAPAARTAILSAIAALHPARQVLVFGIGPSAPLARYAAILLRRIGCAARVLDATGITLADQMLDLAPGAAVLALAYGRAYREVAAVLAEARQLAIPIVLVTDSVEARLARLADVVVPARRGQARHVALHGATLVMLEALIMGFATRDGKRAVATLERLNDLRASLAGARCDVG